jgi:hypothetical protein
MFVHPIQIGWAITCDPFGSGLLTHIAATGTVTLHAPMKAECVSGTGISDLRYSLIPFLFS